jgi:hypothetical protein
MQIPIIGVIKEDPDLHNRVVWHHGAEDFLRGRQALKSQHFTPKDDLEKAKETLNQICAIFADETVNYPEKVGRARALASFALSEMGESYWREEFDRQINAAIRGI